MSPTLFSQISTEALSEPSANPENCGEIAGGHVFDLVAELLQKLSGDMGGNVGARPFEHREFDRLVLCTEFGALTGGRCGEDEREAETGPLQRISCIHFCFPFFGLLFLALIRLLP